MSGMTKQSFATAIAVLFLAAAGTMAIPKSGEVGSGAQPDRLTDGGAASAKTQDRIEPGDGDGTAIVVTTGDALTVVTKAAKEKPADDGTIGGERARYTLQTEHGTKTVIDNGNGTKTVILRDRSGKVTSIETLPMRGGLRMTFKPDKRNVMTTILHVTGGR